MAIVDAYLFPAMWRAFLAYWRAAVANVQSEDRREPFSSRLVRLVAILSACVLLGIWEIPVPLLGWRFLPQAALCFWCGAAVAAAGLAFAVWARRHLGDNWSQAVTVKSDHELITSGPYGLVRHPIYSGKLLGFLGSALACGEWRGLLAVALVFWVSWRKLRLEESWMREQFGEAYDAYSRCVRALLPRVGVLASHHPTPNT